jgi:hypothetical protein
MMKLNVKRHILFYMCWGVVGLTGVSGTSPGAARGEVVVFDDITTVDQPVFIKVLTRRYFVPQGGQRVSLRIAEESAAIVLTGGDGYGYYRYGPRSVGRKAIEARQGQKTATGLLLVVTEQQPVVLIELEALLRGNFRSEAERKSCRQALKTISDQYPLIYLAGWMTRLIPKAWLSQNNYPESVILPYRNDRIFERLTRRKLKLQAAIGRAPFTDAAANWVEKRYSFDNIGEFVDLIKK